MSNLTKEEEAVLRAALAELDQNGSEKVAPAGRGEPGDESREDRKQSQLVVEQVLAQARLFHDAETTYATLKESNLTLPLLDQRFKHWTSKVAYDTLGSPANSSVRGDVLAVLHGEALFEGAAERAHVRLARAGEVIYLDLGDSTGAAVKIDARGWDIVERAPVWFWRPRGFEPLPRPVYGGSVDDLLDILNPTVEEAGWRLQVAWLVAALRPEGPFPILYHFGEQGSAKSTQQKMLRRVIDPNKSPLRATPKGQRDLMVAATNSLVIAFDNLSGLPEWLSDALCRLATGGGFSTRQLYTDQDEMIFDATRAIMLNGISEVGTRPDLLDRSLVVELSPLGERRRPERDLWRKFDAVHAGVLGALCTARALADVDSVTFEELPRMADFAQWATAAGPALGWSPRQFMKDYAGNIADANEIAIESAVFFGALREVVGDDAFEGTMSELLAALENKATEQVLRQKGWPKSASALSIELRRIAPNLRRLKQPIVLKFERTGRARTVTLTLKEGS